MGANEKIENKERRMLILRKTHGTEIFIFFIAYAKLIRIQRFM